MQTLRNAHLIARFVLVWFALSIGVAIASPLVQPQGLQLVCSGAGSLKVIVAGDDGQAGSPQIRTLDCPLCAGLGAPPPLDVVFFSAVAPRAFALPQPGAALPALDSAAPPPARGPPAQA
jgi:hypothetical protein